jgi:hypothetical protein
MAVISNISRCELAMNTSEPSLCNKLRSQWYALCKLGKHIYLHIGLNLSNCQVYLKVIRCKLRENFCNDIFSTSYVITAPKMFQIKVLVRNDPYKLPDV